MTALVKSLEGHTNQWTYHKCGLIFLRVYLQAYTFKNMILRCLLNSFKPNPIPKWLQSSKRDNTKHGGIFLRTGSFASSSQFPEKSPLAAWNSPPTMTIQVTSVDRWSSPIFDVFLNIEQHHFGATVWKSMGRGCQEKVVAMTSG